MVIFVANLPIKTKPKELSGLFSPYGTVSDAYLIHDKVTHRSRGYGFVTMDNDDEAHAAIDALNESEYNGRVLHVTMAKVSAEPQTVTAEIEEPAEL